VPQDVTDFQVVKLMPVEKLQNIDMSSEEAPTSPGLDSTMRNTPKQFTQTGGSWNRFSRKRKTEYLPGSKFNAENKEDFLPMVPSVAVTQRMPREFVERFKSVHS
jgi:hypothetical protein